MHVTVEWHGKQFNVNLHAAKGQDAFLSIKGCRIVESSKGSFVSYPAKKNEETGKWWNHVWGNEKFNAHVKELAQAAEPKEKHADSGEMKDLNDDVPF